MMKFILGVFVSFILGACSSDSGILNPDEEVPVQAETRCCQAAVSSGDSLSRMIRVHSRGWEPSLGNQYPLDYVYILSDIEDDPGEYKPVQSKNEVKMPVARDRKSVV